MKLKLNMKNIVLLALFSSSTAIAQNAEESTDYYTVDGGNTVSIPVRTAPQAYMTAAFDAETLSGVKTIQLMKIVPSERMISEFRPAVNSMDESSDEVELNYSEEVTPFYNANDLTELDHAVDLGMNDVPVLDQGFYGTCVTFSTTAALNARFKIGDYIDQQCILALNLSLGKNLWNGANNPGQIIAPLKQYGIVKKNDCFSVKYPSLSQKVTPLRYKTISDKTKSSLILYNYKFRPSLESVKSSLDKGYRVLLGMLLIGEKEDPVSIAGFPFKMRGLQKIEGLWACSQPGNSRNYCPPVEQLNSGHEVVVIGYDNKQQLLKIRNSWGRPVGDSGDFYMTYKFFNAMSIDSTTIQ